MEPLKSDAAKGVYYLQGLGEVIEIKYDECLAWFSILFDPESTPQEDSGGAIPDD